MPRFNPTSPAGQKLLATLSDVLIREAQPEMFGQDPGDRPLRVRAHLRERSDLQRVILSAVRSGLMRRDARGRFVALDARLRRQIQSLQAKRQARARPTAAQRRALQQATFALLPRE